MDRPLPDGYAEQLTQHFGSTIADRVLGALAAPPSVSVRNHPLKSAGIPRNGIPVPWSKSGFLLRERPNFAQDPLFHGGAYYVQDSSSMIIEEVLRAIQAPQDGVYLDACAAPGGKSTIILDHLSADGFLVANEVHPQRNAVLRENLLKWGDPNHGITSLSTDTFRKHNCLFDLILIDAPCSGEGMFRKDDFAREQWSENLIDQCTSTQAQILQDLKETVRPGGSIIYSTCTTNPKENEEQVARFAEKEDYEIVLPDLEAFSEWLVPATYNGQLVGYYLLPGISTGEGLFLSVLRRSPSAEAGQEPESILHRTIAVDPLFSEAFPSWNTGSLRAWEWNGVHHLIGNAHKAPEVFYKRLGLPAFELKGKNVIPQHGLAMWPSDGKAILLDLETALHYLRKETISLPRETEKGWHLVSYGGIALGWVKSIGTRTNNYYPSGLRLRS